MINHDKQKKLILKKVGITRLIPLFYDNDIELCKKLIDVIVSSGIEVIEFTNRGPNAKKIFHELVKHVKSYGSIHLGIGSIKSAKEAEQFIDLGAKFIVSPFLDLNIGNFCKEKGILWIPGCGTLSEMILAENNGAKLIKLFPGGVYGPKFISSVLAPCPWLKIMPTGGVSAEKSNIKEWLDSGAFCVGMGSNLFPKNLLNLKSTTKLKKHIVSVLENIKLVTN